MHQIDHCLLIVNIVSSDGFFDPKLIQSLGFINATYVMDRWHLRESGLQKFFGQKAYELLKNHLYRLIGAQTEQEFDEVVSLAYELLKSQTSRDDEA